MSTTKIDVNVQRDLDQRQGIKNWIDNDCFGLLVGATGYGKSRCAFLAVEHIESIIPNPKILLVVPTKKLRDTNWRDEAIKWGKSEIYKTFKRSCYVSISKLKENFDLVILDEAHHLTDLSNEFFENNTAGAIISLTATPPSDRRKKQLLYNLTPLVYQITLADARRKGYVAPFTINVVTVNLDTEKNIPVKTQKVNFKTSEYSNYQYITKQIDQLAAEYKEKKAELKQKIQAAEYVNDQDEVRLLNLQLNKVIKKYDQPIFMKRLARMRMVGSSPSKFKAAQYLLEHVISKEERTLIFASSIKQAQQLCEYTFHSKTKDDDFNRFNNQEINRLSCVSALNEGQNIENLDTGLATQIERSNLKMIQRLGRTIRFRPDHSATFWIIVLLDTVDEEWLESCLGGFDPSWIEFSSIEDWYDEF